MKTITDKFDDLWTDFVSTFKGSLLMQARKQTLSFALVKLIFSETCLSWTSEYTVNGRWLDGFIKENPVKGALVKEILTKDMKLSEVIVDRNGMSFLKYAVPVGVGAAGYSIAKLLELGTVGVATSTLVPLAVAIPIANSIVNNRKTDITEVLINGYVRQLDKYRDAVIAALLADA